MSLSRKARSFSEIDESEEEIDSEREEEVKLERRRGEPREEYNYRKSLFSEIFYQNGDLGESEMYANMLTNLKYKLSIPVDSDKTILEKLAKKYDLKL